MFLISSDQKARSQAFESMQQHTMDCLQLPAVQTELGEQGLALQALVTMMYAANVRHGQVKVPRHQTEQDNIAFVATLEHESGIVDTSHFFANISGAQAAQMDEVAPSRSARKSWHEAASRSFVKKQSFYQLPLQAMGRYMHGLFRLPHDTGSAPYRIKSRELVVIGAAIPLLSPALQAKTVGHEGGHALFTRDIMDDPDPVYDDSNYAVMTMTERKAYGIGYTILKHTGELDNFPSVEEVVAARAAERARLLSTFPIYLRPSVAAMVITRLCGNPVGLPSDKEIMLYRQRKLVNNGLRLPQPRSPNWAI